MADPSSCKGVLGGGEEAKEEEKSRRGRSIKLLPLFLEFLTLEDKSSPRILDRGGASSFVIRSFSKKKACVGGGLECLESAGRNCLTDEAGFFGLRFDTPTMATRGHRGAVPTRGDESTGGSQAPAQQAQDQTGVPLPPPLPHVDYGALMQGLVHAMQTQAQTTAALQAQERANVWWSSVLRT
ncbi:hypothetical protein Taro_044368 [Colocasia esculenta]|uniref:Uncharacterized protein n=1 Tax=Colocasia esculenta TaxID=4460 RepID=A0A843X5D7_COLES|nr:hypothetical protein [Colocasia esculenta]